jgi:hypothetical protein
MLSDLPMTNTTKMMMAVLGMALLAGACAPSPVEVATDQLEHVSKVVLRDHLKRERPPETIIKMRDGTEVAIPQNDAKGMFLGIAEVTGLAVLSSL